MVAAQAVEGWRLRGRGSDERGPELALSPDQLIRPLHQGRWERQVQLPGDLMFTTSSNWSAARPEVGGLGTFEDLVHKGGGATIDIARLCSVGNQATSSGKEFPFIVGNRCFLARSASSFV